MNILVMTYALLKEVSNKKKLMSTSAGMLRGPPFTIRWQVMGLTTCLWLTLWNGDIQSKKESSSSSSASQSQSQHMSTANPKVNQIKLGLETKSIKKFFSFFVSVFPLDIVTRRSEQEPKQASRVWSKKVKKKRPASWLSFGPSIIHPIFEHDKVEEEKGQNNTKQTDKKEKNGFQVRDGGGTTQTPRLEKILFPWSRNKRTTNSSSVRRRHVDRVSEQLKKEKERAFCGDFPVWFFRLWFLTNAHNLYEDDLINIVSECRWRWKLGTRT